MCGFARRCDQQLSLPKPSSSSSQCFVDQNSEQPAPKSAFMIKVGRVLRGCESTIFDGLFRTFTAPKDSTGYEAEQTITAREPSIELRQVFLQNYPQLQLFPLTNHGGTP
jgi:hypothetical protein